MWNDKLASQLQKHSVLKVHLAPKVHFALKVHSALEVHTVKLLVKFFMVGLPPPFSAEKIAKQTNLFSGYLQDV